MKMTPIPECCLTLYHTILTFYDILKMNGKFLKTFWEKGENAGKKTNQPFLLFPNVFYPSENEIRLVSHVK